MLYSHPVDPQTYDAADPFGHIRPDTGRPHLGSDYKVPSGTAVYAIADGVVVFAGWSSILGNLVGVLNDDGKTAGYAHNLARNVSVGDRVTRKTTIVARSGNTGSASKGDHVHFSLGDSPEAYFGYTPLTDPWAYIESHLASLAGGIQNKQEEEMALNVQQIHVRVGTTTHRALVVPGTGYFVPWVEAGADVANSLSTGFGTGPSVDVKTKSMYDALAAGATRMQDHDA